MSPSRLKPMGWCVVMILALAEAAHFIPLFVFLMAGMVPFPALILRLKQGAVDGRWTTAAACLLIFILFSQSGTDRIIFAAMAVLGLLIGEGLDRQLAIDVAIGGSAAIVWIGFWLIVVIFSTLAGFSFFSTAEETMKQSLEITTSLYEQMNVPPDTIATLQQSMDRIAFVLVRLLPGFSMMSLLFVGWVQLFLVRILGRKWLVTLGNTKIDAPLNQWRAPDLLIWILIGCGAMIMVPHPFARLIGINVLLPVLIVYMFQGIGIVSYLLEKTHAPRWLRVCIYIAVFSQQIAMIIVMLLGIFDLWMDFRKTASKQDA